MSEKDEWGLPPRIELDYNALTNPAGYQQKDRGVIYKYILGSAFAASFVEFVIFFVITIIWFVIFEFAIVPKYPSLFPISGLYQVALFFVITFAAALFIGQQQNLYQDLIRLYSRVLGNTNTLAMELAYSLNSDNLDEGVENYFRYENINEAPKKSTYAVKEVYRDLNEILRSITLAQRFEHRTQFQDARSKATHLSLDRSNTVSGLELERLPMRDYLINEIRAYQHDKSGTGGLADQMWDMVYKRIRVLGLLQPNRVHQIRVGDAGAIYEPKPYIHAQLMQTMDRQMSGLTTDTAEIIGIKYLRVLSIIIYFLLAAVYVWCFSIGWQLWGDYGWVGLIAAVIVEWFILALYRIGVKLTDPFASWNNSHWTWIDMTRMAVATSKEIDEVFDRLFEQTGTPSRADEVRRRQPYPPSKTSSIVNMRYLSYD
jgi:hypothetical protein